jgi:hypothetical protein
MPIGYFIWIEWRAYDSAKPCSGRLAGGRHDLCIALHTSCDLQGACDELLTGRA